MAAAKNALATSAATLTLLEIAYPGEAAIRITSDNAATTWGGYTWYPYPFSIDGITETKDGDQQTTQLVVPDPERRITPHLDEYSGGVGAVVTISIVLSTNLASPIPEAEYIFSITRTSIDHSNTISFELGSENFFNYRFPQDRYLKNHCRYKTFKTSPCLGAGGSPSAEYTAATTCDRSFTQCRIYGNQERFGGFPSIGRTGVFK
jgi:phage-related protein